MNVFAEFEARIAALLRERIASGSLPEGLDLGRFVVEPPRDPAHGDLACNVAMALAKDAKPGGPQPPVAAFPAADRRILRARRNETLASQLP